ncbi:DUF6311 domain-containing protein [Asticcacaulis sp.]|uniref:DUF6311 domain-containing protein n=1 Tax=Asticcacaulis sp. TaxID=1872648 RepID=UPI003918F8CC
MPDSTQTSYYRLALFGTPVLLFLVFFNPAILDPTNIGWLMHGDWGQHFLGWHAYRNGADGFNHQDLLAHPTGLSILYTDSNPLFSLPLKLISPFLPANFQFIGPWFLLCLCLHYVFALRLMERYAPGAWSALGGALLLCLLPTLYNRIGHDTLFAHWLILWSLYIFFVVETPRGKATGWAANLTLASLIHPYLLLMCLFIWAADQWQAVQPLRRTRDLKALSALAISAVISAGLCLTALWAGGAFSGTSPAGDGFGIYSMGLDGPFNPSGLPSFLSFLPRQEARQGFEGFQYLGAGLLVLVGAAWWMTRRTKTLTTDSTLDPEIFIITEPQGQDTQAVTARAFDRARTLKWVLIALSVLAVSTKIQIFGKTLIDIPLPEAVVPVLGVIRASGRLFWPVAYTLIFLSLLVLYRSPKRTIWLGLIVGLQILDLGIFAGYVKGLTARASDRTIVSIAKSPQWTQLIAASAQVNFVPPDPHINTDRFYNVAYRAVSAKVPVTTMYGARPDIRQQRLEMEGYSRFLKGEAAPDQLYVYLNPCPPPPALRARLRELDGYWILPPLRAASVGHAPVYPTLPLNAMQTVARDKPTACGFGADWALPEEAGIWTQGSRAVFLLPTDIDASAARQVRLTLNARRPSQVTVSINDKKVATLLLSKKPSTHSLAVPAGASGPVRVSFVVNDPPAPGKPVPEDLKRLKISQWGLFTAP